jgi:hypothetical protein
MAVKQNVSRVGNCAFLVITVGPLGGREKANCKDQGSQTENEPQRPSKRDIQDAAWLQGNGWVENGRGIHYSIA